MSEGEATPVVEVEANVPKEAMDINTAVRVMLKKAMQHDGLARGLHEAARAVEKGWAQLCILAEDTDSPDYKKLIEGLCAEQNVNLISVPTKMQLGEMAGLCRIDAEGNPQKVVACSCAVVTDYGEESEGLSVLQEYLKAR
uniref:40S ribosomal protein S12 n=3 Tax=Eukaryota TaxID=2759 RepID=A0A6S8IGQ0_DUNTE|mmetsp:Transcript_28629/g.77226  ORF Transcript_28629/g.77226 Transcript_28629/m.77226 type:complete len:141 (-) Transcript_28629:174-596(-)|eukprot:CAMPEP_0202374470 /NCGR_PEP_ID=MMETSP1127-20130417/5294_1 /ASSEMBLY_ACC=CAM_ASM_000462 /TAXON_ID=3047 /ORGANISM="Dunaliella tertiolecta, Strain CCMP1320" /LENGTH=140 /DNA_ID=CAMNT_0048971633 /DNA_START=91 /DNA_END=513 /DNA_ORIENTATION=+